MTLLQGALLPGSLSQMESKGMPSALWSCTFGNCSSGSRCLQDCRTQSASTPLWLLPGSRNRPWDSESCRLGTVQVQSGTTSTFSEFQLPR
uniref:Uncharacterized protein n=1 Tax=Strigops habroptila TaxID=2489341 RepID=A0A672V2Z7_STRHB